MTGWGSLSTSTWSTDSSSIIIERHRFFIILRLTIDIQFKSTSGKTCENQRRDLFSSVWLIIHSYSFLGFLQFLKSSENDLRLFLDINCVILINGIHIINISWKDFLSSTKFTSIFINIAYESSFLVTC